MGTLEGKVAIVTGGGRGIGAAISHLFAQEGASLVVNDLGTAPDGVGDDEGPAQDLVAQINAAGGQAISDGGDIADVATGQRLVDLAVEKFGRLDIVVNAAGILRDRMIFNMSEADWDAVIRVHLKGHFSTIRPASAYFRQQKNAEGNFRIINFTSVSGLQGSPGQANYAAAKMGVVGLTYSLAQGLSRYGVTANAIAPGAATRLTATVPDAKQMDSSEFDPSKETPEDIAPLALYLASDRSTWLTGRVLSAQGNRVGIYPNPEEISVLESDERWKITDLSQAVEKNFRPIADGLPPSLFAAQLRS
ncbi:short-chain dehydrogenase [Nocardia nova]|uniref:Short-chain dehydrogenase n=1 Tax=Nocardia nova TaxID=37330 RepID=A0A2S6AN52_9NOCA|nr:short-chain dehydrogenase [Nocardia nova]PPJ36691.1 short-chain dehydrogenase [Nocardia nova]